jgi:hypothetical protein
LWLWKLYRDLDGDMEILYEDCVLKNALWLQKLYRDKNCSTDNRVSMDKLPWWIFKELIIWRHWDFVVDMEILYRDFVWRYGDFV